MHASDRTEARRDKRLVSSLPRVVRLAPAHAKTLHAPMIGVQRLNARARMGRIEV